MLARRSLQSVARCSGNVHTVQRQFSVMSIVQAERAVDGGSAAQERSAAVDFAAELRRALGKRNEASASGSTQERGERRPARRESGGARRGQARSGGAERPRRSQPSVLRKTRDNNPLRTRFAFKKDNEVPRKIAEDIRPVTDWSSDTQGSVPYTRVPYNIPSADLQSLHAKRDLKAHKPLKVANRALTMSNATGVSHLVRGLPQAPTPLARPGKSAGEKPKRSPRASSTGSERKAGELTTGTSSVAAEAREERLRLIRENVGGDYDRWSAQSTLSTIGESASDVEKDAAFAISRNYDMQPSHKTFTMNAVHSIIAGTTGPAKADQKASKRK